MEAAQEVQGREEGREGGTLSKQPRNGIDKHQWWGEGHGAQRPFRQEAGAVLGLS